MAVTTKPIGQETPAPYTMRRAFVWPEAEGGIAAVGTVLQLTKTQATELLNATKIAPGEPEPSEVAPAETSPAPSEVPEQAELPVEAPAEPAPTKAKGK